MNKDIILIILLIILIVVVVYSVVTINSEARKCLSSPLTYGIDKFSEANNENIECNCDYGIFFNRTSIILKPIYNFPGG